MSNKLQKMTRFLPALMKPETNVYIRGLLHAWSSEDDKLVQACQDAKDQIFVQAAKLQYLDSLGSNVGVFRPTAVNLSDGSYRNLIPALSFAPKQVVPTIKKVLDVFFEKNNPRVFVHEIRPNEITIQIPSSVPSLRRSLKGAIHFHLYSGWIRAIDNIAKTITIDLEGDGSKILKAGELSQAYLGQDLVSVPISDNTEGNTGVTLQCPLVDLTQLQVGGRFRLTLKNYPGAYLNDPTASFTVTKMRGVLGQNIEKGTINPTILMKNASGIPDKAGLLILNWGRENVEANVKYFGRPNNATLLVDPSYTFTQDHSIGEAVNVIVKPYQKPNADGTDFAVYLVGVTAARILAQQIVESVVAAGVVVKWIVVEPKVE